MSVWDTYPENYRENEIRLLLSYVWSGMSAAVVGLSGSGKSNLFGFMVNRVATKQNGLKIVLIDCNRLLATSRQVFLQMMRYSIEPNIEGKSPDREDELSVLDETLARVLVNAGRICFLFDRFDALYSIPEFGILASNLRALRDRFKYQVTYLIGGRRSIEDRNELAELFFGRTIWLGPLSRSDASWSCRRDGQRLTPLGQREWDDETVGKLIDISWGYPSLLRAVCEAYASGARPENLEMLRHPAVIRCVAEFWADAPNAEMLRLSGIEEQPLLVTGAQLHSWVDIDPADLTAKEHQLLEYLKCHIDRVCTKDELVQAVWPEDVIYEHGVRDESLAQLVHRLRVKIEQNPTEPDFIQTVPGRGYIFRSKLSYV
jgi:hypothetical protein